MVLSMWLHDQHNSYVVLMIQGNITKGVSTLPYLSAMAALKDCMYIIHKLFTNNFIRLKVQKQNQALKITELQQALYLPGQQMDVCQHQ